MMNIFCLSLSGGGTTLSRLTLSVGPFTPYRLRPDHPQAGLTSFIEPGLFVDGGGPVLWDHHRWGAKVLSTRTVVLNSLS